MAPPPPPPPQLPGLREEESSLIYQPATSLSRGAGTVPTLRIEGVRGSRFMGASEANVSVDRRSVAAAAGLRC